MPKIVSSAEYEVVVNAVRQHPDGARIEMIQSVLGDGVARRTLQRRLNELVKQGRLVAEGRKRGALYRLPPEPAVTGYLCARRAWAVSDRPEWRSAN